MPLFAELTDVVPANILTRVFQLRVGPETASGFTIEAGDKQFLITAKHAVQQLSSSQNVEVFCQGKWQSINSRRIDVEPDAVDIAVLELAKDLSDKLPIELAGMPSSFLSQGVFFVGFPFGLSIDGGRLNRGFPLPLVKHGIIASISGSRGDPFLVDGINNPGFSGGPIVRAGNPSRPAIVGVISGYRAVQEPVYAQQSKTNLSVQANTGLLVAFGLEYAPEAIKNDSAAQ